MYHLPEYIHAIHADRLREAEAARRANSCFTRRQRWPLLRRRRVGRPSRSRAPNTA